jgi:hypothetical protein
MPTISQYFTALILHTDYTEFTYSTRLPAFAAGDRVTRIAHKRAGGYPREQMANALTGRAIRAIITADRRALWLLIGISWVIA